MLKRRVDSAYPVRASKYNFAAIFFMELIFILISNDVLAQTAEETAAYILFGIEDDGVVVEEGKNATKFIKISDSPLIFKSVQRDKPGAASYTITIASIDSKCRFRANFVLTRSAEIVNNNRLEPSREEYDYGLVDFSQNFSFKLINSNDTGSLFNTISFKGLKRTCEFNNNVSAHISCDGGQLPNFGSSNRIEKAITYLRAKFCSGRAF